MRVELLLGDRKCTQGPGPNEVEQSGGTLMTDTIICPRCNYEVEVTTALSAQLREQLRKEMEGSELERFKQQALESVAVEFADLQGQLAEARNKLGLAQKVELQ